jgi:pimeloyl-ACP methyl ester carboxylesterase
VTVDVEQLTVRAPDGRDLEVLVVGRSDALALVHHPGTPAGPVVDERIAAAATANDLRLVMYARPGYGTSTPRPGRTVASAATDTATVLDHLGAGQFVTMGHSGGGPHALACAALLPDRCLAAASVAGVAPWDAEGLDVLAGMGPENVEEFSFAVHGSESLTAFLTPQAEELARVDGPGVVAALGGLLPDVDKLALTGEFGDHVAASFHRAVEAGIAGWHDDDLAFVQPWGFDLADIRVPVAVWQGAQDLMVPFAHGRWLAAHVPGVTVHLLEDHGHLSLTHDMVPAIVAELAGTARR